MSHQPFKSPLTMRDLLCASLLGTVGGWIDASSYLRFDTFAGAMTGNSVLLGLAVAHRSPVEAFYHLIIIGTFLVAIAITRHAIAAGISSRLLLQCAGALILGSLVQNGQWSVIALAMAMGCQNAAIRKIGGVAVNTVFVSGDLVRFGESLPRSVDPHRKRTLVMMGTIWLAYVAGAVFGSLATEMNRITLFLPAGLLMLGSLVMPTDARNGATS